MKENFFEFGPNYHRFHTDAPDFRIAIITGVCRSGKTMVGQMIGSMNNVEYLDEPWFPTVLSVMQHYGSIDPEIAADMFRAFVMELFNDIILLRQSNFRPNDLSTIWARKDVAEIFERLMIIHTRDDVKKYIDQKKPLLLLNLAELTPFIPFFIKTFPDCKVMHITRNGFDVAQEVVDKRWFKKNNFHKPLSNYCLFRIFKDSSKYYIPWWVKKGEEKKFLKMNDYTKGLYYWRNLLEFNKKDVERIKKEKSDQYLELKFENIVEKPGVVAEILRAFLGVELSQKTQSIIGSIDKNKVRKRSNKYTEVPADELEKGINLLNNLGYEAGGVNSG